MKTFTAACLIAVLAMATIASAAVELSEKEFGDAVAEGSNFVKFYAPWCGHCKRLAPTWDKLAAEYEEVEGVNVVKVDCTKSRDVCKENGVRGYPTLKLIKDGDIENAEKYRGGRDFNTLKAWLDGQTA